ncbi:MAG TPA: diacylglycerol kinase family protein [Polyangiaceae bacterium]|jgi:diacylglycerol kinase family enzyme
MSATHLLVANPTAQSGKNQARIARVRALLEAAGVRSELLPTEPAGRTTAAVARTLEAGEFSCVIAMGGDGTFREVAAGVLSSAKKESVALGMIPTGTANDQGRSFGLSAGEEALERNVSVVVAGRETRLDAGKVSREFFFDSIGWGISARVLRERNLEREAVARVPVLRDVYRDHLVYASALLRVFLDSYVVSDKFDAEVTADGRTFELEGLTDLIVKATRVYGGAWVFDRHAAHDDGKFEIVPFRGKRDWTSKAIVDLDGNPITEEMLNTIGVEHSKPISASRIELRFRLRAGGAPFAAQMDGEELEATEHARIEVVPRALRLIIP